MIKVVNDHPAVVRFGVLLYELTVVAGDAFEGWPTKAKLHCRGNQTLKFLGDQTDKKIPLQNSCAPHPPFRFPCFCGYLMLPKEVKKLQKTKVKKNHEPQSLPSLHQGFLQLSFRKIRKLTQSLASKYIFIAFAGAEEDSHHKAPRFDELISEFISQKRRGHK